MVLMGKVKDRLGSHDADVQGIARKSACGFLGIEISRWTRTQAS